MQTAQHTKLLSVTAQFLPEDGDVRVGTPDGRTILLGGLSPLALPDVLMAPCFSMSGVKWGVSGLIEVGD